MKSKEIGLFLFSLATLLLNWPFLEIFSMTLPLYLFGIWGIFIIIVSIFINTFAREHNRDV